MASSKSQGYFCAGVVLCNVSLRCTRIGKDKGIIKISGVVLCCAGNKLINSLSLSLSLSLSRTHAHTHTHAQQNITSLVFIPRQKREEPLLQIFRRHSLIGGGRSRLAARRTRSQAWVRAFVGRRVSGCV
jgi:hypothetical protein